MPTAPAQDPNSPYYDALILYASAIVNANSSNMPNVAALANPHGLPMEILEIRFRVYPQTPSNSNFLSLTGQSIGVKLDLGSIAICESKAPISSFSSERDVDDEGEFGIIPIADPNVLVIPYEYSWRLKYPLLVPSGAVLSPAFEHLGQNAFPVVVDVVYFCRSLPPDYKPPAQVMVPWVTAYNSQSYDNVLNAPAATEVSSELDIVNPFSVPLEIARLTGSAGIISTQPGETDIIENAYDHRFRLSHLSARGSRGDEIIRAPTPFNLLFPTDWRVWDIPGGWIFRPGEFYKFNLRVQKVDYTPSAGLNGRTQFSISAVGYRPINTRDLLTHAMEAAS